MGNVEGAAEAGGMKGMGKGEREKYNKLRPRAQKQRDNSGIGGLCDTPKAKRKAILIPFSISRSCGIAIRARYASPQSPSFFSGCTCRAYFQAER